MFHDTAANKWYTGAIHVGFAGAGPTEEGCVWGGARELMLGVGYTTEINFYVER